MERRFCGNEAPAAKQVVVDIGANDLSRLLVAAKIYVQSANPSDQNIVALNLAIERGDLTLKMLEEETARKIKANGGA